MPIDEAIAASAGGAPAFAAVGAERKSQAGQYVFRKNVQTAALVLFSLDFILCFLFNLVLFSQIKLQSGEVRAAEILFGVTTIVIATLLFTYGLGLYRRDTVTAPLTAMARLPVAVGLAALTQGVVFYLFFSQLYPGEKLFGNAEQCLALVVISGGVSFCGAMVARGIFDLMLRRHWFRRRILVIGTGHRALYLQKLMVIDARRPIASLLFVPDAILIEGENLSGIDAYPSELSQHVLAADRPLDRLALGVAADEIVMAADDRRDLSLRGLLACKVAGFPVTTYDSFIERETGRIDLKWIEVASLAYSSGFRFRLIDRVLKRVLDIALAIFGLVLTLPVLVVASVCIFIESPGPILFRQERVTKGGKVFRLMKLRSMRLDAEKDGPKWADVKDSRITRVGGFLRRTRIDEIPQLVNVLLGDMSMVGPRPERPVFIEQLVQKIDLYAERHIMKAGLTGWAQINYPYGASVEDARSKLEYDLYYVKNFSIILDVLIILQTARIIFWPNGVR